MITVKSTFDVNANVFTNTYKAVRSKLPSEDSWQGTDTSVDSESGNLALS